MGNPEHGSQGLFPLSRIHAIIVLRDFQSY